MPKSLSALIRSKICVRSRTPQLIVSGTIGERDVPEFQRVRGEYGEWRTGITVTRQNVENDVGGMDALAQRLGAGGLDRRQPVVEYRREDFHHLPIAIGGAGELAADFLHGGGQDPGFLNGAPFLKAPGLRARTGT